MHRDEPTIGTGGPSVARRDVLKTAAVGTTVGGLAALSRPVAAQDESDGGGGGDLASWLSNVDNADEVVDHTGEETVTVDVGVQANGGAFGFGPAVVRVDPGTTVVWEWTGEGTPHNVVAEGGAFESELLSEAGVTFEHTVESEGVVRYVCTPHESMGMKGAIVVGDVDVSLDGDGTTAGSDGGDGGTADGSGENGGGDGATAGPFDYGGWFADVDNFDGTVDATGREEVRIAVGAEGNGGHLAFDPPAVQVDPGTSVVWEWTGEGGQHDVALENHDAESSMQSEEGATYALEFDGNGIVKYACTPHKAAGMKGAVVVGEGTRTAIDWLETGLVGLAGAIVAAPFVAGEVLAQRRRNEDRQGSGRQRRE